MLSHFNPEDMIVNSYVRMSMGDMSIQPAKWLSFKVTLVLSNARVCLVQIDRQTKDV